MGLAEFYDGFPEILALLANAGQELCRRPAVVVGHSKISGIKLAHTSTHLIVSPPHLASAPP